MFICASTLLHNTLCYYGTSVVISIVIHSISIIYRTIHEVCTMASESLECDSEHPLILLISGTLC